MIYFLQIGVLGNLPKVILDAERFFALKAAKCVLSAALSMEELYELLIANYKWLEEQLVTHAVANLVYERHEYSELFAERLAFNTAFVNLLTSARLYVDQICSKVAACAPLEVGARQIIKTLICTKYDASKSYRFMEALRNHVQHAGLAVDTIEFSAERKEEDNYQSLQYTVRVTASKDALAENSSFKKSALEGLPDNIDLVAAARDYVEALSSVHQAARDIALSQVANARTAISLAINEYRVVYGQEPTGLNAVAEDNHSRKESIPILLHWDNVRMQLERRNCNLVNLSKRFVTSRIEP